MSSDSDDAGPAGGSDKQVTFVNLLREHPVLLSKSQLPKIKEKKTKEITELVESYKQLSGIELSEKQAWKKINNMKTEVKSKADMKKTGNKPLKVKDWEKVFLDIIQAESNPSFSCVKGGMSVGVSTKQPTPAADCPALVQEATTSTGTKKRVGDGKSLPPRPEKKIKRFASETEETEDLSTQELQRLVLLEQLKLLRLQQQQILAKENM